MDVQGSGASRASHAGKRPHHHVRGCTPTQVYFNSTSVPARPLSGGWFSWSVPLATFKCQGALDPNELNRFDLQNVAKRDAVVCVTDVALV